MPLRHWTHRLRARFHIERAPACPTFKFKTFEIRFTRTKLQTRTWIKKYSSHVCLHIVEICSLHLKFCNFSVLFFFLSFFLDSWSKFDATLPRVRYRMCLILNKFTCCEADVLFWGSTDSRLVETRYQHEYSAGVASRHEIIRLSGIQTSVCPPLDIPESIQSVSPPFVKHFTWRDTTKRYSGWIIENYSIDSKHVSPFRTIIHAVWLVHKIVSNVRRKKKKETFPFFVCEKKWIGIDPRAAFDCPQFRCLF